MSSTAKNNARKAPEAQGERDSKRPRLENETKYTSIPEIQAALNANSKRPSPELVKALTTLRNQISLRHSELQSHIEDPRTKLVPPNDERLLLVEEWTKASPGLPELFEIWGYTFDETAGLGLSTAQAVASLVLSTMTSILSLLSTSYAFQAQGIAIVKNIDHDHWRQLNAYIAGGQSRGRNAPAPNNELILVSLRLLAVISERWDSKRVFESFGWEAKSIPKLLAMRRKTDITANALVKPDIRTAYIVFLLSFLTNAHAKSAFLSTSTSLSAFTSVFKTLQSDHPSVVKRVLEVCWEGVWCDIRLSRSLKVGIFGDLHGMLGHLLKLYERTDANGAEYSPADLVHHFLLATCTRPGVGLCFKDRGWYNREADDDSLDPSADAKLKDSGDRGKIYNILLSQLLRQLKVTDDPRQQELALKILAACPELVAGYLPNSGLTLDPPRLSSKWLANIAFVTGVISLPVPVESFYLAGNATDPSARLFNPVPPSVGAVLGNIIPGSQNLNMKNVFTKGLQFAPAPPAKSKEGAAPAAAPAVAGNLVQHTTALALIKCLDKLARVKAAFEEVSAALGEGEVGEKEGQWSRRLKEVMREIRRRLPEFQVVIAFCSAHLRAFTPTSADGAVSISTAASQDAASSPSAATHILKKKALLAECAMRLLWMYQKCLPEVVEGARFDVGKILVGFEFALAKNEEDDLIEEDEENAQGSDEEGGSEGDKSDGEDEADSDSEERTSAREPDPEAEEINVARRLHRVTQLHILRFLKGSSAFVESGGWTGKIAAGQSQTHFHTLLEQFLKFHPSTAVTTTPGNYELSIHIQLAALVKHILGSTLLFQDDSSEVDLWLNCLPYGVRRVKVITRSRRKEKREGDAMDVDGEDDDDDEQETLTIFPETPDGSTLTDEREGIISFLDDCVQRCLKTPYKYIEEMATFASHADGMDIDSSASSEDETRPGTVPSPLLAAVVEQLVAKVRGKHLTPSDALAITTFLRKLMLALLGKTDASSTSTTRGLALLLGVSKKIDDGLDAEKMAFTGGNDDQEHAIIRQTMRREIDMIKVALDSRGSVALSSGATEVQAPTEEECQDIDEFLELVDGLDLPPSKRERQLTAFELIDWFRLLHTPLNAEQTRLIFDTVKRLGGPWAVRELAGCVPVGPSSCLWAALQLAEDAESWIGIPIEYLLRHAPVESLSDEGAREVFVASAAQHLSTSFLYSTSDPHSGDAVAISAIRVVRILLHHLALWRAKGDSDVCTALLALLGRFLGRLRETKAFDIVKQAIFNDTLPELKAIMTSRGAVALSQGILAIQTACLDFTSANDRSLVREIVDLWGGNLLENFGKPKANAKEMAYALSWMKFMDPLALLDTIESVLAQTQITDPNFLHLLRAAAEPLQNLASGSDADSAGIDPQNIGMLGPRLPLLFKLQAALPTAEAPEDASVSEVLEELIAVALEATLPMGLNGSTPGALDAQRPLAPVLRVAESRWTNSKKHGKERDGDRGKTLAGPNVASLLQRSNFTRATGRIVGNLLYCSSGPGSSQEQEVSVPILLDWLDSEASRQRSLEDVLPVIYSIFDSALHNPATTTPSALATLFDNDKRLAKLIQRLLKAFTSELVEHRDKTQVKHVLTMIVAASCAEEFKNQDRFEYCLSRLKKSLGDSQYIAPEWISTLRWIQLNGPPTAECREFVNEAVENSLQHLIRELGAQQQSGANDELDVLVAELGHLVDSSKHVECSSSTVETLIPVFIEHHLAKPTYLTLVEALLKTTALKPLTVNRYLQAIVQHLRFYRIFNSASSSPDSPSIKDALTSLLHTMFHLHPANTCQVSHVEPLVRVYRGTLSKADRRILDIFHLFEMQRKLSVAALFARWSNSLTTTAVHTPSSMSLEALLSLDAALVLRTALCYPFWRNVEDRSSVSESKGSEEQLYDPVFLLLLFAHVMTENPPASSIGLIEVFRTNIVGIIVRTLSSSHDTMRKLALSLLVSVWKSVEASDLQEKGHLLYIFNQIRNVLPPPASSFSEEISPLRLPSYITLMLFHSLRGVMNPSHFMYPTTSRFLLQRPELDITDVPMLYSLLYSSSDDRWRKERGWILRFLADGMLATGSGSQDWKILKRRHTWDLLASMYQGANSESAADKDRGLRQAILSVLVNLTRHRRPCLGLSLKSGLFAWMEMQLKREAVVPKNDALAWIKIIENIVLVLDKTKLEGTSLEGVWQATLWRCLALLLGGSSSAIHVLPIAARVMVRLSVPEEATGAFSEAMSAALERLQEFESNVHLPDASTSAAYPTLDELVAPALHSSLNLHEVPTVTNTFVVWGRVVELLWRIVMQSRSGQEVVLSNVWDRLSSRLLVWRAAAGLETTAVGEWARVECLRSLK